MKRIILALVLSSPLLGQTNIGSVTTTTLNGIITPNLIAGVDNAATINAAITAASSGLPNYGGKVLLPPGVWNIGARISLPRGVVLEGAGTEATILYFTGSGVAIYHGDGNGSFAIQRGGIRDLGIRSQSNSGTIGIFCGGDPTGNIAPSSNFCQNVFYENVYITGFDIGYEHGSNSFWITFVNPTISANNIGATGASGVVDTGEAINWFGGRFNDNYNGAFFNDGAENNLFGTAIDFNGNYGASPQVTNSYISAFNSHWEVHTGAMAKDGVIRLRGGFVLVDDPSPSLSWLFQGSQQQNNISIDAVEIYSQAPVASLVNWFNGADPSSQLVLRHLTGNHNTAITSLVNIVPGNLDVDLDSYFGGAANAGIGITTTKTVGACTLTIKGGLITSVTGC